jgi:enoyl-CoA hydratase
MGLASRVAPAGGARRAAEALGLEIARFPQACMRQDRQSALEQGDLDLEAALANELRHGLESLRSPDALQGARRFAAGDGRHGGFER